MFESRISAERTEKLPYSENFCFFRGLMIWKVMPRNVWNDIVVLNRAQRCESHNLACSGGWEGQRVESSCGHFGQERRFVGCSLAHVRISLAGHQVYHGRGVSQHGDFCAEGERASQRLRRGAQPWLESSCGPACLA